MITEDKVEKIVAPEKDGTRFCILTSRYYDDSLAYFLFLFGIAKKDFPELEEKDCKTHQYAGRFRKGMRGLEFSIKADAMPEEYKEWSNDCICTYFPT